MLHRRDVVRLLVKFCGLLIVLDAVISLPVEGYNFSLYLSVLVKGSVKAEALIFLAVEYFSLPFIYLIVGFGIIWWARRGIAGAMRAGDSGSPDDAPQLPEIEAILIAVLGVYYLCDGFTDLVRTTGWITFNVIANGAPLLDMAQVHLIGYGVAVVKLGIGALLILRREGVATLRRRIPQWAGSARRWRPFQEVDP